MRKRTASVLTWSTGLLATVNAISLDLSSPDSIKSVTSTLAYDMMTFYSGNLSGETPGLLPGPCASDACYSWWEAGAMFGSLVNYWQYTGDSSYNDVVSQALLFQVGPDQNYNPPNQSSDMSLDHQLFWAFSALDAAEANFPNPPKGQPSWLALAKAVFNFQTNLWDSSTCGGGFRWQVYPNLAGYNLKNAIANGGNFQLAARLARYTGDQSYADWAEMVWDWIDASPLIEVAGNINVWDSTDSDNNCTNANHDIWTYNYGTILVGCAYMYNFTGGNATWAARTQAILEGANTQFFPEKYGGKIMSEIECEPAINCDNNQTSFKAYLSRWMAVTSVLAPFLTDEIMPKLQASAVGAAGQCDGGANGRLCGMQWFSTTWDGSSGVGQQMCALSVIGANLITPAMAPAMAPPKAPPKISQSAAPVDITHHPHHLSAGVIAGSTVGAIAGLVLLVVLVSFLQLHRRRRRKLAAEAAAAAAAAAAPNDKPQLHSDDVKPVRTELDAGIKSKPLPPKEMAAKEELIRTVSEMPANEIVGSEMET